MSNADLTLLVEGRNEASKVLKQIDSDAGGLGNTLGSVGKIATGFLAADVIKTGASAIMGFLGDSVSAASDLGESVNAVNVVFGDSAGKIMDWGQTAADQAGLSQRAFNQLATPLGAMLKNTGMEMDDVADNTINLTKRAADMASVFNTDVGDALTAIQAALRGESDPIEKYGVSLSAAKVEAKAMAETGKTVASSLTDQEKAAARLSLIFEQTAAVENDFINTSDSYANSQRIAAARTEELQAEIGEKLIPVMAKITEAKLALVKVIADHVLPVLDTLIAYFGMVISDGDVLNDHLSNLPGPIRGIVQAVGELIAYLAHGQAANTAFGQTLVDIAKVVQEVVQVIRDNWPLIQEIFGFAIDYVRARIEGFIQQIQGIVQVVTGVVQLVRAVIDGDWAAAWEALKQIAEGVLNILIGNLKSTFGSFPDIIYGAMVDVAHAARQLGEKIVRAIMEWLETLPGKAAGIFSQIAAAAAQSIPGAGLAVSAFNGLTGRHAGGPVMMGRPYLVGERGPEIMVPNTSGTIIPNDKLGGGSQVNVNVYLTVGGSLLAERDLIRVLRDEIQRGGLRDVIRSAAA